MLALTYPVSARRLPLTACFLILLADLLTFSRGGYLGVVVGIFILFFLISIGRLSQTTLKRALISGAFALLMGLTLFLTPFGTRLISSFSSDDGSNIERLRLWQEAVSHIADRPFLGTGIGNYPLLVKPTAEYREPIYIHNLFLDIASETGLPGLTAFLGLLGTAFVSAFTAWRKYQDHLGAAVFIALSIFSTHAFFELPLYSVQVLPFFLLIAALAITSTRDHHGSDSHPNTL
jgi:putative inorganic carbon (HCO3(-)) transporter